MKEIVTSSSQVKLVLLGDAGVGKTSLAVSLSGRDFNALSGVTAGVNISKLDNDIDIVDFGGQQIFNNEVTNYLDNLDSSVAIVAIDSRQSGIEGRIEHWLSMLAGKKIQTHIVVTKSDVARVPVNISYFKEKYCVQDIHYVSAKNGEGIQELRSVLTGSFKELLKDKEESIKEVAILVRAMIEQLCDVVARNPDALQDIEWRDLERLIASTLEGLGFSVKLTPPSKDGGKDVIANCVVGNENKTFYIEIKHWKAGGKPGDKHISEFVEVNASDNTDGGLFLSSSGFTKSVYGQVGELRRQKVRLGGEEKIVSLCKRYINQRGIWISESPLPELLFENTI